LRLILFGLLVAFLSTPAFAAGDSQVEPGTYILWGTCFFIAYVASSLFVRLGQAGVVGALLAGVAFTGLDGIISIPDMKFITTVGVAALLFEAGLESDLVEMRKELVPSIAVAIVGVIMPAIAGACYALWALGISSLAEVGTYAVALTATSVGISLQVLKQMNQHESREARIIIGAAVIDDILGMSGLAALSGLVFAGAVSYLGLASPVLVGLAFIAGFILIGAWINTKVLGERSSLAVVAFFCTISLAIASQLGIAIIIATFVAGAVMKAEKGLDSIVHGVGKVIYAPAFLAVGLLMDWGVMSWSIVPHILILSVLAFATKFVAGYAVRGNLNKPLIGSAMASRGEVGLAVVSIATANAWISAESFAILTGTIILVTVVAPFAMKHFIATAKSTSVPVTA
jgi:Kef-type K+ transport system membrane component KefB